MKYARNTFLALVLLVLIYGSCYRLFYRSEMLTHFRTQGLSAFDFMTVDNIWRRFYAPAGEIDLRLTVDRAAKRRLQGHWRTEKPGDFVTIDPDGQCRFQLGEYSHELRLSFTRAGLAYRGEFEHGECEHSLIFRIGTNRGPDAHIVNPSTLGWFTFPNLTRAPAPD